MKLDVENKLNNEKLHQIGNLNSADNNALDIIRVSLF